MKGFGYHQAVGTLGVLSEHIWGYDFVIDQTADAHQLECMTVVDEFMRHRQIIDVGHSLTAGDVIRSLDHLCTASKTFE